MVIILLQMRRLGWPVKYGHVEIVTKLLNIPVVRNGIHRYDKEQNLLISETNRPVSYHQ